MWHALVTGIVVAIAYFTGLIGTLFAIFPMKALEPVLLYIAMVIGVQSFNVSPRRRVPAIIPAFLPSIAQWFTGQIDNALAAAGKWPAPIRRSPATVVGGSIKPRSARRPAEGVRSQPLGAPGSRLPLGRGRGRGGQRWCRKSTGIQECFTSMTIRAGSDNAKAL